MQFRRMLAAGGAALLLAAAVGCSGGSSNSANSSVVSDVILGSSDLPAESDSTAHSSANSGPPTTLSPGSDAAPRVPNGAVMAATIMVNSGPFSGKSTIESNGSVGCSYSLFGDKLWRINFNSQGEFESTDTTSSGRHVVSFDLTAQPDGTGDMGILYTETSEADDLRDRNAAIAVQDSGTSVKFNYTGRNSDGTLFHGAAMCTKPLRSQ